MNPAHAENIGNIFLCHLNDQPRVRRLIHGQQVQEIAELHLRGIEFLMDGFKEKAVDVL